MGQKYFSFCSTSQTTCNAFISYNVLFVTKRFYFILFFIFILIFIFKFIYIFIYIYIYIYTILFFFYIFFFFSLFLLFFFLLLFYSPLSWLFLFTFFFLNFSFSPIFLYSIVALGPYHARNHYYYFLNTSLVIFNRLSTTYLLKCTRQMLRLTIGLGST